MKYRTLVPALITMILWVIGTTILLRSTETLQTVKYRKLQDLIHF